MDPVEAELRAHRVDLFAEDVHRPLDVLRPVRASAPDLVVDDDRPLRREPLEGSEVVMRASPGPPCSARSGVAPDPSSPATRYHVR